ncbi:MAG: molybdate ABC transporter substrate-binding protein [Pseudomonadota bacterium]
MSRINGAASAMALLLAFGTVQAAELTVSAAASLTNAIKDIGTVFEAQNPGSKVLFNFAASGALLQQIAKGAPVDVFASADQETMDQAQAQHLIQVDTRHNFVRNTLVVIVPSDAASAPTTLQDLLAAKVARIAIGTPASVPVGRYAKGVLEKAQLWAQLEPKTMGALSVRQALDYVARGEVDAGFVYSTDAALMPDKVKVVFAVPTETPVLYPIALIAGSPNAGDAAKFMAVVLSPPAQAIFARYGFGKP